MAGQDEYKLKIDIDVDEFVKKIQQGLKKAGIGVGAEGGVGGTSSGGRGGGSSKTTDWAAWGKAKKGVIEADKLARVEILKVRDAYVKQHTIMRAFLEGVSPATIGKRMITANLGMQFTKSIKLFQEKLGGGNYKGAGIQLVKLAGIAGAMSGLALLGKALIDSSPVLQAMLSILEQAVFFFLRPIGDFMGFLFKPFILLMLKYGIRFYKWAYQNKLLQTATSAGKEIENAILNIERILKGQPPEPNVKPLTPEEQAKNLRLKNEEGKKNFAELVKGLQKGLDDFWSWAQKGFPLILLPFAQAISDTTVEVEKLKEKLGLNTFPNVGPLGPIQPYEANNTVVGPNGPEPVNLPPGMGELNAPVRVRPEDRVLSEESKKLREEWRKRMDELRGTIEIVSKITGGSTGAKEGVYQEPHYNENEKRRNEILKAFEEYKSTVGTMGGVISPYQNYANPDYYKEGRTEQQIKDDEKYGTGEKVISPQRQYIRDMIAKQEEEKVKKTENANTGVGVWGKTIGVAEEKMKEIIEQVEAGTITWGEANEQIKKAQDAIDDMAKAAARFRPNDSAPGMQYGSGSAADQSWAGQYLSGGGSGTQSGGVSDMLQNMGAPKPNMTPQEKVSDLLSRYKTAQAQVQDWSNVPGMFGGAKITAMANQASGFNKQLQDMLGQTAYKQLMSGELNVSDMQFDESGKYIKTAEQSSGDIAQLTRVYQQKKAQYNQWMVRYNENKGKMVLYGGGQVPWEDTVYSSSGGIGTTYRKSTEAMAKDLQLAKSQALAAGAVGLAHGGIIREPIFGIGKSGTRYNFGEQGPERISPMWRGHESDYMRRKGDQYFTLNINIDKVAKEVDIEDLKRRIMMWIRDSTSRKGII